MDLIPHGQCFRDFDWRPAMEREYEFVPLIYRRFDEASQCVASGHTVALGRVHIREHLLEGAVREEVQQVPARREMTVERSNADTGVCRDGRHGYVGPLTVHGGCRGTD